MAERTRVDRTTLSRRGFGGLLAGFALLPSLGRAGDDAPEPAAGGHARVRLIDAGPSSRDPHERLVGIAIDLDAQYLTYWRSPGEAGVPPTASFAGSTNLKDATLLYPAPGRYSEDGTEAIGYKDGVVFPVLVAATDPAKPVTLALDFSFAVCERLCLPAHATAKLALEAGADTPDAGLVREALARVPAPARVGQVGALEIVAVQGVAGQDSLTVLAKTAGDDLPLLFAEAPDPWFVQAGAGLWTADGAITYEIRVLSKPAEPAALPLRLTLAGIDRAIEVPLTLDAPPPKP